MARQHRVPDDELGVRDDRDPGDVAAGDAQLDQEPPNVVEAEPPADAAQTGPAAPRPDTPSSRSSPSSGGAPSSSRTPSASGSPRGSDAANSMHTADSSDMQVDVETLQREISQLSDRHLRLVAEFDNYRKRIERERADAWGRAQAEFAARILDPLDDLERVTHHAETSSPDALLQGVQLVERKLKAALQAAGLEIIDAEGARFDPNSMEAVAMTPAESHADDDIVSDVFQRGYRFKGTLIRPARVRVKKHGA